MASSKTRPRNQSGSGSRSGPAARNQGGSGARDQRGRAARRQEQRAAHQAKIEAEATRSAASHDGPPQWLRISTLVLAVAGLAVSIYLTYTHFTDVAPAGCSEKAGAVSCVKVTTSPESEVFGVIPVALLGLIYYVFMVAIMSPWAWNARLKQVAQLRLLSVIAGVGMVVYLLYAELFQIDAICLYCTSVHAITFVLFVLVAVAAALWGLGGERKQVT